jgi:hypothetical protein
MPQNKYRWSDGKLHSISEQAHKDHVKARQKREGTLSLEDRVKRDPKLLARALKDPGLRSKLPDRYLNPAQVARRHDQQFRRDVGDINDPLSGDSLVNSAEVLTNREFDPLEQDIGRQEDTTRRQTAAEASRAAGYYSGLGSQLGASLGAQGQANAAAVQAAQARGASTAGAIDAASTEAKQRADHDAQVRGAAVQGDALEQMAAQAAQQKAQAAAQAQSQTGAAQSFGDAQAAFLRGIQGATAQAGGETQGQIHARGGSTLADLAAERAKLRADRKGSFTDTLLKLRSQEADRALTARGLANDEEKAIMDFKTEMAGLKSKAQVDAANRRLKLKLTEMGLDSKAAQAEADRATQQAIAEGHDATSTANNERTNSTSHDNNVRNNKNKGGAGGFTHKERVDAAGKRDDALTMAQQYKQRRASRDVALQLLTEKYGSDFARVAISAIYDTGPGHHNGHLNALLQQRYGISIPQKFRH